MQLRFDMRSYASQITRGASRRSAGPKFPESTDRYRVPPEGGDGARETVLGLVLAESLAA